jgi:hypothetical protein
VTGVPGASGCQWWQNTNYLSFKCRMKQEFEERGANVGHLSKIKTTSELSDSKKFSGTVVPLYQPGQISEMMDSQGRGTLSLLSNKPLRVGSHCIQNKILDQSK